MRSIDKSQQTNAQPVVLVVEIDIICRNLTVDLVKIAGCVPIAVNDCYDAIDVIRERDDIALVVTDITITDSLDGLSLAHAVRERWPPINILVVSKMQQPLPHELPTRALFMAKPFEGHDLVSTVRRLAA